MVLKDGELIVWSDDVVIEGISQISNPLQIKLNESHKVKVAILMAYGLEIYEEEGVGKILNDILKITLITYVLLDYCW